MICSNPKYDIKLHSLLCASRTIQIHISILQVLFESIILCRKNVTNHKNASKRGHEVNAYSANERV